MLVLLLVLVALYALVCTVAWALQERLVYFPSGRPTTTPAALGLDWAEIRLETEDGVELGAWYLRARPLQPDPDAQDEGPLPPWLVRARGAGAAEGDAADTDVAEGDGADADGLDRAAEEAPAEAARAPGSSPGASAAESAEPSGAAARARGGRGRGGAGSRAARGAVLVSHGNGGHLGLWLETAAAFCAEGFDVLLYDYRGYGTSGGSPSEEGTYRDAEAAWRWLAERHPPERIVLYGTSLGGAVAVELARRREVAAVIVEATFTSIVDVGAEAYPWLPVRWLARIRYDTLSRVAGLDVPLLVLHSPDDELIPFEHGQRIADAAGRAAELRATRGGHQQAGFLLDPAARATVRRFLRSAVEP